MSAILLFAAALALPGGVIEIAADGKSSEIRKNVPDAVTLESGEVYGFSYSARSSYPAHCLAGTSFAAMGRGEPGDGVWRRRHPVILRQFQLHCRAKSRMPLCFTTFHNSLCNCLVPSQSQCKNP